MSSKRTYFEIHQLQNLTTEFPLVKSLNTAPLEAVSIDHRYVSFEAPHRACAVGQLINIEGVLYFQQQKEKFYATAKVTEALELDGDCSLYTVELHRYDINLWNDFRSSLNQGQQDVDRLFRSMRDIEL